MHIHLSQPDSPASGSIGKGQTSTVIFLLSEILLLTISVYVLRNAFHFPNILREPAANAFALFRAQQSVIVSAYYGMLLSALLYVPLSYGLTQTLSSGLADGESRLLIGLGLATALLQALGFSRWIFVMPYLTEQYFAHPEWHNTLSLLYETMNRYAGMTIGEHLGFLAMGSWTLALSRILQRHPRFGNRWALACCCLPARGNISEDLTPPFSGRSTLWPIASGPCGYWALRDGYSPGVTQGSRQRQRPRPV